MKKVILAALASTVIASSASASFYAGVNFGGDVGRFASMPEVKDKLTDIKLDRQMNLRGNFEFGYNVMDNLGIGLEVGGYLSPEYKKKEKTTNKDFVTTVSRISGKALDSTAQDLIAKNKFDGIEADVSHKFSILSGIVKARLDLVDFDMAQIYVSGGVGAGYICEELVVSTTAVAKVADSGTTAAPKGDDYEIKALAPTTVKMKSAYGLAFSAGAGVAFKLSDAMCLNVGVEYANMGKTGKEFEDKSDVEAKKLSKDGATAVFAGETAFDAINAVVGVRFHF